MIKTLKQLIHVLWAIEKDLRVIASNTEALSDRKNLTDSIKKTRIKMLADGSLDVGKAEVQAPYVTNAQFSSQRKNPSA
ncbi:hypothetical protein OF387_14955 [Lentilactobacillus hilgardii]|nr:hypothetical protein [Lentilactobacillus hilgardii]MCV3742531.1 hypothetical protein [Lentilactobacillus hilgardii]